MKILNNKIAIKIAALVLVINLGFFAPVTYVLAQEASPSPDGGSAENTASAENTQTGSTSDNTSNTTIDNTSNTTNNNTADATNNTTGTVDSGTNTASDNTGNATVGSSDATANSTTSTNVNETYYEPMPWTTWTGQGDWTTWSSNNQTGSGSDNSANTTVNQTENLTNTNNATVNNTADTGAATGSNTASDNTGNATIATGDATNSSGTSTVANTNYIQWTGQGDWTNLWNGEALNWMTGSNSTNESAANFSKILDVLNQNGVDVNNLINSFSHSGNNIASDNTGNATIHTGDASVLASLFNMANSNIFGANAIDVLFQDIYGNYSGNVYLSSATPVSLNGIDAAPIEYNSANSQTGFNSTNNATVVGSLVLDILNDNSGVLHNLMNLEAITGENTASDNTGNGFIETGNAEIIANLINFLNTNIFANDVYLGMVNVFGDWAGNLVLPEYNGTNDGGSGALELAANNGFTGSNSDNNSTTNISSDASLTNNNTGIVNNNFNAAVETGNNSASDNTMHGFVNSGNAFAEGNVANWVNTNVISDSPWWLVLVNNLGHWTPVLFPSYNSGTQVVLDIDDLGLYGGDSPSNSSAYSGNNITGSLSDNNATTDLSSTSNITNNNTGTIHNNVDALALTGNNEADRNTGSGTVLTGDASVWINALNFLNTNVIAPSFMITIVNIFGSWTGDILNYGEPSTVYEPPPAPENPPVNSGGGIEGQQGGSGDQGSSS
ncbi:hypothetical protein HYS91_00365, partial [Candidatus Daviesbacteria bacterium]|nr:hypothetical protein [Candidatus Daviesbacteria bacterium]